MTTSPLIMSGSELGNGYGSVNAFAAVKGPGGARGFIEFLGNVFDGREDAGSARRRYRRAADPRRGADRG
ncbi:hypothetical protein ACFWPH_09935 [Nocardia sp. NPDC058499]|uniref:hypothetical protein n=1 Tax=Nocardia sp. NPDC058499 TaxID=3346530 RepID=UPI003657BF50